MTDIWYRPVIGNDGPHLDVRFEGGLPVSVRVRQTDGGEPVPDLREFKWLDPECHEGCQSLRWKQVIAEDCCSKIEANQRIADAQSEAAKVYGPEIDQLRSALEESVKLQSHYAWLLNDYDGGERRQFSNASAWVERLKECGKLQ